MPKAESPLHSAQEILRSSTERTHSLPALRYVTLKLSRFS
jgi:hypothetical protein